MPTKRFPRWPAPSRSLTDTETAAMWAVLESHVAYEGIQGNAWTRAAALGRFYGVSVRVRDCTGGAHIDLIEVQEVARFYRCQVCERLLVVQIAGEVLDDLDPRLPRGTDEPGSGPTATAGGGKNPSTTQPSRR